MDNGNIASMSYMRQSTSRITLCLILIVVGVAFRPVMYLAMLYVAILLISARVEQDITVLLIALLNVSMIFKLSPGSTSLYTYLELLAIVKMLIMDHRLSSRFFVGWGLYTVYLFIGSNFQIINFVKASIVPLLLYLMIRKMDYKQLKVNSFYYIFGVIAGSIISLARSIIPNMQLYVSHKEVYLGVTNSGFISSTRFSGLWGDPNYYSIHLILSITICAVFMLRKELKPSYFYTVYGLMILFGAMTGSKSFFLMLIFITVLFVIGLFKIGNYKLGIFFVLLILVFGTLVLSGAIEIFDTVLTRLQYVREGQKDLTTGRASTWLEYLRIYMNNPVKLIFGRGIGNGYSYNVAPHNTYIDFIDYVGLLGSTIFIYTLGNCSPIPKTKIVNGVTYFPLLVLAILYFFLSMFYGNDFVFELLFAFGFSKISIQTSKLNEQHVEEYNDPRRFHEITRNAN